MVLLVLGLLLPLSSLFHSVTLPSSDYIGIGQDVIVVAKEDNAFVRVSITVQPLVNGSGLTVVGGAFLPAAISFPNGTTINVRSSRTFQMTLPNSVVFNFGGPSATGPGYDVSPGNPISVQLLSDQNGSAPLGTVPGIEFYQFIVTGDVQISAQAMGVCL